jgi:hypothetical protein
VLSPPEDNARGRLLSPIFDWLDKNLSSSPAATPDMFIKTNTRKVCIFIATEDDQWLVASLAPDTGDAITFHVETLAHFSFDGDSLARHVGH